MGTLTRSSVQDACARAHGEPFGMEDKTAEFGCRRAGVVVVCTPDLDCAAQASDTVPVTGNSLDEVLGIKGAHQGAVTIGPVDARIKAQTPP